MNSLALRRAQGTPVRSPELRNPVGAQRPQLDLANLIRTSTRKTGDSHGQRIRRTRATPAQQAVASAERLFKPSVSGASS
jgi:hypothetical protein